MLRSRRCGFWSLDHNSRRPAGRSVDRARREHSLPTKSEANPPIRATFTDGPQNSPLPGCSARWHKKVLSCILRNHSPFAIIYPYDGLFYVPTAPPDAAGPERLCHQTQQARSGAQSRPALKSTAWMALKAGRLKSGRRLNMRWNRPEPACKHKDTEGDRCKNEVRNRRSAQRGQKHSF